MNLIRSLDDVPGGLHDGALTIGNFDGIHLGHARIISRLRQRARQLAGPSIVFTFDPHPVRLLRPSEEPPPLTWTERKADLLSELGVDYVIAYPTDEELLALSPEDFFDHIIVERVQAKAIVEGPNFFFGRNRAGNVELLTRLCGENAIEVEIVKPIKQHEQFISSSRVRNELRHGNVSAARQMLTKPYRIRGMVIHGARRGSKIGFPTANLDAIDTLIPADGVYAGRAHRNGERWTAAISIGPNPTFRESHRKVEVHLLDFEGSLYGEPLEVDFLARIRDIRPFGSVDELTNQLQRDIQFAREQAQ